MTAPPKCTGGAITTGIGAIIIIIGTGAGGIAAGVTAGADAHHFKLETHRPAARRACCFVIRLSRNRSSAPDSSAPGANVDELAGDRGGGGHRGRHQMGAALVALAALEIAVRGRGAALARLELVRVHGEAHGATGLAPFEAGGDEDLVETFRFGLLLHAPAAGPPQGFAVLFHGLPRAQGGARARVLEPAVGARADEHAIDRDI